MRSAAYCPQARADLSTRVVGGETVVLDRSGQRVHQLNATASLIWELCNGERTETEIAGSVAAAFEVELDRAAQDVTEMIAQFKELGLLRAESRGESGGEVNP